MSFVEETFRATLNQLSFGEICQALYTGYQEHGEKLTIQAQTQSLLVERWSQLSANGIIRGCSSIELGHWLAVIPYFDDCKKKTQLLDNTATLILHRDTAIPDLDFTMVEGVLSHLPRLLDNLRDNQSQLKLLLITLHFIIENLSDENRPTIQTITTAHNYLCMLPDSLEKQGLCSALIGNIKLIGGMKSGKIAALPLLIDKICQLENVIPSEFIDGLFKSVLLSIKQQQLHLTSESTANHFQGWLLQYLPVKETACYEVATTLLPDWKKTQDQYRKQKRKSVAVGKKSTGFNITAVPIDTTSYSITDNVGASPSPQKNQMAQARRSAFAKRPASVYGVSLSSANTYVPAHHRSNTGTLKDKI